MTLSTLRISVRRRILFLLPLFTTGNLCAQSLSLFNVDATNFPQIEARILALDANGEMIAGLSAGDLRITENAIPVSGTVTVDCPTPSGPTPMSVALVVDRSGSMVFPLPNGETPLELIRIGATAFLETLLFTPPTAVAITGFNESAFLISDFRASAPPLVAALNMMVPDGGTLYDPAFLDPIAGGIELLGPRPASTRKVLIFISDGEPNRPPSTQAIIDAAAGQGVTVYTITIGVRMTSDLLRIAQETGGTAYGDVTSSAELTGILRSIALISHGTSPCRVRWTTHPACGADESMRIVTVAYPSAGLSAGGSYRIPADKRTFIEASEKALWFGPTAFPNSSELPLTITARNGAITVTDAAISDPTHFRVLDWRGPAPPFTLNPGESRTVTVQFVPTDTAGYAADLTFHGNPCPSGRVLLAGGRRLSQTARAPLVLRSPLGGELFDGCDSVTIRWGGVPPEQPVRIQYSNGGAWQEIADSATGYEHRWFPPEPGDNYRIRISTDAADQHVIYTIAGGGDSLTDGIFGTEAVIVSPWGLDVDNDTLYIAEAGGRNRVRTLDLFSHVISTVAGTGAPGNGGDGGEAKRARFNNPVDVLVTDSSIFIADRDNFKIRVVDRATGIVSTFAGNGAVGFSPDGTRIDTGTIGSPTALATDGTYLYFSEISSVIDTTNHRVRRIDLGTRVISTIAGGGTFYDSDGAPASRARLLFPYGIALHEGFLYFAERDAARVRRVDMTTGIITTVAGTGRPGSSGDGGPATNAELNSPTDLLFIDGRLYITESTNGHRIRSVDIGTGIISTFAGTGQRGFAGDSGSARLARLNEPTSMARWGDFLFVSDRLNGRIRAITLRLADGLDSSAAPFSVVAPRLQIASAIVDGRVDVGSVSVDALRDSIVLGLICNTGTAPLVIDSAHVIGANAADFRVAGGLSNVPILPGECRTVAFEFMPSELGERNAAAVFYGSCTLPDTVLLTGTGEPECKLVPLDLIDFGQFVLGTSVPDTVVTASFCNRGSMPVSGEVELRSPNGAFTIVRGGGPFTLGPDECLNLTLRFRPTASGLSMAIIDYGIPAGCGTAQTVLSGRGLIPQALAAEGFALTAATCPDDPIDTAVVLRNTGGAPLRVTGMSFALNDEGFSILSPIPTAASPLIIPAGGEENVSIRFAPIAAGAKNARLVVESNNPDGDVEIVLSGRRDSLRLTATASQIVVPRIPGATYPRDTMLAVRNTGDRAMTITGAVPAGGDASFLAVSPGQFPVVVQPGTTEDLVIRILQPSEDRQYRTDVAVSFEPSCTLPAIIVPMIHAGSGPVLSAGAMSFPILLCDDPPRIDTAITVVNFGGSDLRIEAIAIVNDPEGNFSTGGSTSIVIPPGGSVDIPVSFAPASDGAKSATLRLTTNTENGFEEIGLTGTKRSVSFTLSRNAISFDPAPGGARTATVDLRNTGTYPIAWSIGSLAPPYTVLSVVPPTSGPGETSVLTIRYDGPPEGAPDDSLAVGEAICGTSVQLRLGTDNGAAMTEAWLPHDSALFNTRVTIPLRYRLIDGATPGDRDTFMATIRFIGTTFFFEGLTSGEVIAREWDPGTRELTITIRGAFGDRRGDTLTGLVATALLANTTITPLAFEDFAWSRPSITATAIDGSFKVLGTCLDSGLHLSARPPEVQRIRPNPSSDQATAEIVLGDWAWLRAVLIAPTGKAMEVLSGRYVDAGRHELTIDVSNLPSGVYMLRVETPHGSDEATVVVGR